MWRVWVRQEGGPCTGCELWERFCCLNRLVLRIGCGLADIEDEITRWQDSELDKY